MQDVINIMKSYLNYKNINISPLAATLEVTKSCNLHCLHCYNQFNNSKRKEMTLTDIMQSIDLLSDLNVIEVTICGGEPLLRNDIFKIIQYIKNKKIQIVLLSNGLLMNEENIANLKYLFNENDLIQVSLDDICDDLQRRMSKVEIDTVLNNIKMLNESGLNITLNTVITKYNEKYLFEILKYIQKYKIKSFGFTSFVPFGGKAMDDLKPNYKQLNKLKQQISDFCEKNDISYSGSIEGHACESTELIQSLKNDYKIRNCDACTFNIHISSDGYIYPCVFMEFPAFIIGSINDARETILENMKKINSRIKVPLPEECQECTRLMKCGGGCPGLIFDRFGDLNEKDPRCVYG